MQESSKITQPNEANSYSGVWMKADQELPEDGAQVIIFTDDNSLGFGYFLDGQWQLVLPPWAFADEDDAVILYWTEYPPPPWE